VSRYGLHRVRALWPIAAAGLLLVVLPAVARADDCSGFGDCFGTAGAAVVTALGAGFATVLHFFRGGYPDLPPNLMGPGQYGPYGNPVTDAHGNPLRITSPIDGSSDHGFYIGTLPDGTVGRVTPSYFTDPATGKDYVYSAGAMIYFSLAVVRTAEAIIPPDRPTPGGGGGKA
jgi:hypothetical protein